ncbi:DUF2690 domain-containing protein [Salinithrix halophila]|uniref:DUF2690 domain-containing protein n=1 Tax=Salinithrix halophila TaxID=1485204 RepID=A0ABV8JCB0_9BACL
MRKIFAVTLSIGLLCTGLPGYTAEAASYDGTDPVKTGCSKDAVTIQHHTVGNSKLELRRSQTCKTVWSQLILNSSGMGTDVGNVTVKRQSDSKSYQTSFLHKQGSKKWIYTRQVMESSPVGAHAVIGYQEDGHDLGDPLELTVSAVRKNKAPKIQLAADFSNLTIRIQPTYKARLQSAIQYVETQILPDMAEKYGNPMHLKRINMVVREGLEADNVAEAWDDYIAISYHKTKGYSENKLRDILIHEIHHLLASDKNMPVDDKPAVWPHWLDEGLSHHAMFTYAKRYGGATQAKLPSRKQIVEHPFKHAFTGGYEDATAFIQFLERKSPGTIRFFYSMKQGDNFEREFKKRFKQDPAALWYQEFLNKKSGTFFSAKGKETAEARTMEQKVKRIIQKDLASYVKKKQLSSPVYLHVTFDRNTGKVVVRMVSSSSVHVTKIKNSDIRKWLKNKQVTNVYGEKVKAEEYILDKFYNQ